VKHGLNKVQIAIIILLIAVIALPLTYVVYTPSRAPLEAFFGGFMPVVSTAFTNAWATFIALPYWPAILFFGALLVGIIIDRWAWKTLIAFRQRMVGSALRDSGLRYQQQPQYQTPIVQQTTAPAPPTLPAPDTTVLQTTENE